MFLNCKYLSVSKQINNLHICNSVQTINSVAACNLSKYSSSSPIQVPSEIKNRCSISDFHWPYKKDVFHFSQQPEFSKYDCFCQNNSTKRTSALWFPSFLFKLFYCKCFLKTRKHILNIDILLYRNTSEKVLSSKVIFSAMAHFFVPLQSLSSNFLNAYILAINTRNSIMIFPTSSSFIHLYVVVCFHPLNICLCRTLFLCLLHCLCKNTGLFNLILVFPIFTTNNTFENDYPSLKFSFIT